MSDEHVRRPTPPRLCVPHPAPPLEAAVRRAGQDGPPGSDGVTGGAVESQSPSRTPRSDGAAGGDGRAGRLSPTTTPPRSSSPPSCHPVAPLHATAPAAPPTGARAGHAASRPARWSPRVRATYLRPPRPVRRGLRLLRPPMPQTATPPSSEPLWRRALARLWAALKAAAVWVASRLKTAGGAVWTNVGDPKLSTARRVAWGAGGVAGAGAVAGAALAVALFLYGVVLWPFTPSVADLRGAREVDPAVVLSADGTELTRFARRNREWRTLDEISPFVVEALVATEDRRFYDHGGIDLVGLGGVAVGALTGDGLRGGLDAHAAARAEPVPRRDRQRARRSRGSSRRPSRRRRSRPCTRRTRSSSSTSTRSPSSTTPGASRWRRGPTSRRRPATSTASRRRRSWACSRGRRRTTRTGTPSARSRGGTWCWGSSWPTAACRRARSRRSERSRSG